MLDGMHGLAASLSLSNEAFLLTFNKSLPTAIGLLGERGEPALPAVCPWPKRSPTSQPPPPLRPCSDPLHSAPHRCCGARCAQRHAAAGDEALHMQRGGRRRGGARNMQGLQALIAAGPSGAGTLYPNYVIP